MFESRTVDEIVRIADVGDGFRMDASSITTDDLYRIAFAAAGKGSRIILEGLDSRTYDELWRIAKAGEGCIVFESKMK